MKDIRLYKDRLMDHYQHPRHKGDLAEPDFVGAAANHSCGDAVVFKGNIEDNILKVVVFDGAGCVISQASASLLAEAVVNKKISDIIAYDYYIVQELLGVDLGPVRMRCAVLALEALQKGIRDYVGQN